MFKFLYLTKMSYCFTVESTNIVYYFDFNCLYYMIKWFIIIQKFMDIHSYRGYGIITFLLIEMKLSIKVYQYQSIKDSEMFFFFIYQTLLQIIILFFGMMSMVTLIMSSNVATITVIGL